MNCRNEAGNVVSERIQ